ncbi:MAG: hypothetical protein JW874_03670 [Spirochaetales bacterium]|nr:hypothetical protein [Spirochaetales bacterium]
MKKSLLLTVFLVSALFLQAQDTGAAYQKEIYTFPSRVRLLSVCDNKCLYFVEAMPMPFVRELNTSALWKLLIQDGKAEKILSAHELFDERLYDRYYNFLGLTAIEEDYLFYQIDVEPLDMYDTTGIEFHRAYIIDTNNHSIHNKALIENAYFMKKNQSGPLKLLLQMKGNDYFYFVLDPYSNKVTRIKTPRYARQVLGLYFVYWGRNSNEVVIVETWKDKNHILHFYDYEARKETLKMELADRCWLHALSPDGRNMLVNNSEAIFVYNFERGEYLKIKDIQLSDGEKRNSYLFYEWSPDSNYFYYSMNNVLYQLDIRSFLLEQVR